MYNILFLLVDRNIGIVDSYYQLMIFWIRLTQTE